MSDLVIVRGLPGSGKTTFAKTIDAILVEADDYFLLDGIYKFDGRCLKEAHQYCYDKCKSLLESGYDVVVANVFDIIHEIKPYLYLGYPTTVYKMCNVFENVHNVPFSTMRKYAMRWENYAGEIEVKCK